MKKSIFCILSLICLIIFSGCGENSEDITLIDEVSDMTKNEASVSQKSENISRNDVLSIRDGIFYLENKPFAEISFNKFDLLWQIITPMMNGDSEAYENMLEKQEKELSELHEMGMRSIRVFMTPWAPADFKKSLIADENGEKPLYKACDIIVALCEKYDIKLVWCLGVTGFVDKWLESDDKGWRWEYGNDQMRELISDDGCAARAMLNAYIDEIIPRYASSKAVLCWELANEITLDMDIDAESKIYDRQRMPTMDDVRRFFDSVSARIHERDPLRLVNSGGSMLRDCQYNQYTKNAWLRDTKAEQFKALSFLYSDNACDIIDIHWYPNGSEGIAVADGIMTIGDYAEFTARIGKPLMIGELGLAPSDADGYFTDYADKQAAAVWVIKLLDEVVENGVQLSYWWQYGSDRPEDVGPYTHTLRVGENDELLELFSDANRALRAKFGAE